MNTDYAIGIDIGGTNVKTVVVKRDGSVIEQSSFPTHDGRDPGYLRSVSSYLDELERRLGPTTHIGVSSPGLGARDGRSISWMAGRMTHVVGLDWGKHMERSHPVWVLNDAHAALLGECWLGAAREKRDVVMLTLGTGVGGAIVSGGRLLRGAIGRAGHLGHMSIDPAGPPNITNCPGSIEYAMGDYSLVERTGGRFASTAELVRAASSGDAFARETWTKSVRALAAVLTSLGNAIDPEMFVLGGGIAKAGEALFAPLNEFMQRFEWRPLGTGVPIVHALLDDAAGAFGCAWNAFNEGQL
jgi:glucokinase